MEVVNVLAFAVKVTELVMVADPRIVPAIVLRVCTYKVSHYEMDYLCGLTDSSWYNPRTQDHRNGRELSHH